MWATESSKDAKQLILSVSSDPEQRKIVSLKIYTPFRLHKISKNTDSEMFSIVTPSCMASLFLASRF
jgi:hypothetical protein